MAITCSRLAQIASRIGNGGQVQPARSLSGQSTRRVERGPGAFHATGRWLREAFSDLRWTTEHTVAEGDLVVTFGTMSGRHTGNLVVWTKDARVERVFVPTGRTFTVQQAHVQSIPDGLVVEHWAAATIRGWPSKPDGCRHPWVS